MEPMILVAGSAVGAFTAMAIGRVSKNNVKPFVPNSHTDYVQKRVIMEAMNRVYDYERQGKITSVEREKLLAKYRQELNTLENRTHNVTLYNLKELNTFKETLVTVLDQRMAQISSRLDDLTNKIENAHVANKPRTHAERKEEKPEVTKPVEHVQFPDSDVTESDANLEEIKKQIMQTLSRLEQAEVE